MTFETLDHSKVLSISLLYSVLSSVIQVKGQEGEGLKMVPKRQIQLKKKDCKNINKAKTEKLKV